MKYIFIIFIIFTIVFAFNYFIEKQIYKQNLDLINAIKNKN